MTTALSYFVAARYDEAFSSAESGLRDQPNFFTGQCVAAASGALAGKLPQAEKAMAQVRRLNPALRVSNLRDFISFARQKDFDSWVDGLRRAGLPE
jgi:hypothetical protein